MKTLRIYSNVSYYAICNPFEENSKIILEVKKHTDFSVSEISLYVTKSIWKLFYCYFVFLTSLSIRYTISNILQFWCSILFSCIVIWQISILCDPISRDILTINGLNVNSNIWFHLKGHFRTNPLGWKLQSTWYRSKQQAAEISSHTAPALFVCVAAGKWMSNR